MYMLWSFDNPLSVTNPSLLSLKSEKSLWTVLHWSTIPSSANNLTGKLQTGKSFNRVKIYIQTEIYLGKRTIKRRSCFRKTYQYASLASFIFMPFHQVRTYLSSIGQV